MTWGGWSEFLHMGGYGLYVWGSYVVTLGALAIETLSLARRERATVERLKRELGRAQAR